MRMRREACHNGLAHSARSFARQAISSPQTPGSMSNTPARPCTTTALLWQNSLSWIRTPFATCLSTGTSYRLSKSAPSPPAEHEGRPGQKEPGAE